MAPSVEGSQLPVISDMRNAGLVQNKQWQVYACHMIVHSIAQWRKLEVERLLWPRDAGSFVKRSRNQVLHSPLTKGFVSGHLKFQ